MESCGEKGFWERVKVRQIYVTDLYNLPTSLRFESIELAFKIGFQNRLSKSVFNNWLSITGCEVNTKIGNSVHFSSIVDFIELIFVQPA
jgi:hypothetical protein